MSHQLVLQFPSSAFPAFDRAIALEMEVEAELEGEDGTIVDGNDIGAGYFNIFIFTEHPHDTFARCVSVVRRHGLLESLAAGFQPEDADDYVRLYPADSTEPFDLL